MSKAIWGRTTEAERDAIREDLALGTDVDQALSPRSRRTGGNLGAGGMSLTTPKITLDRFPLDVVRDLAVTNGVCVRPVLNRVYRHRDRHRPSRRRLVRFHAGQQVPAVR